MVVSFRDDETATIWGGLRSRRLPPDIQATGLRKLRLLNNARGLKICGRGQATVWKR